MKKSYFFRFTTVLLAFFIVLITVSCNENVNNSNISSKTSVSTSSMELNKNASIRVWFTMNTVENDALVKIANDFKKETGVSVEVLDSNFFSIRQKFPNAANSSQKPDIVYIQSADLGILAQNGYLRTVDWLDGSITDRFYDLAFSSLKYDNKYYGVGYSTDAYGIVYNKALISTIPATWRQYFVKAHELTKRNGNEITLYGTQIAPNNYWFIYPLIKNEGGYYFGKNTDGSYNPADIGLDNAGTIAAMNKILALKADGLTTQAYTEIDSNISSRFSNGKVAMFIYGLWDAAIYKSKGIDYGYAPLPDNDDGSDSKPLATVQGFVLNKFTDWPKESDAFLKYILQDDHQQELYEAGNGGNDKNGARNTCNKAVVASAYVQSSEILKSLVSVSFTAEVFPTNPEAVVIWTYSTPALNSIFFKAAPVDTKLKEFADSVKSDIASMKG